MQRFSNKSVELIRDGMVSGFIATAPMTMVMEGMRRAMPDQAGKTLPPQRVMHRAAEDAGWENQPNEGGMIVASAAAHFAFGAFAGGVYGAIPKPGTLPPVVAGIAFGITVWAVSYMGVLPALGWHPPAQRDRAGRNAMLIVSHVVWGAATGALVQAIQRGRLSARRAHNCR